MKKVYLVQLFQNDPESLNKTKEGDKIEFEMPSFCSGDYEAKVYKDEHGLYIKSEDNNMRGCRDYSIKKGG